MLMRERAVETTTNGEKSAAEKESIEPDNRIRKDHQVNIYVIVRKVDRRIYYQYQGRK